MEKYLKLTILSLDCRAEIIEYESGLQWYYILKWRLSNHQNSHQAIRTQKASEILKKGWDWPSDYYASSLGMCPEKGVSTPLRKHCKGRLRMIRVDSHFDSSVILQISVKNYRSVKKKKKIHSKHWGKYR